MNTNPLDIEYLSVDDILLAPAYGVLKSRTNAVVHPHLYSAPMDTVTGIDLTRAMLANNQYPVVCRYLHIVDDLCNLCACVLTVVN